MAWGGGGVTSGVLLEFKKSYGILPKTKNIIRVMTYICI